MLLIRYGTHACGCVRWCVYAGTSHIFVLNKRDTYFLQYGDINFVVIGQAVVHVPSRGMMWLYCQIL